MKRVTKKRIRTFLALLVLAGLGVGMLYTAESFSRWQSAQIAWYNFGLDKAANAQSAEDVKEAFKAFDQSIKAYEAQSKVGWYEKYLYPQPSKEYVALAHFQKAKLFLLVQQPDKAVASFKEALKVNPGGKNVPVLEAFATPTGSVVHHPAPGFTWFDVYRLDEQAKVTKYDLELLFKKSPSMANGEGKGKGKGKPKPGNQPADQGKDPSNAKEAGHGTRDDI